MENSDRYTEWSGKHGSGKPGKDCYTRLALYEDTKLTPDEVMILSKRNEGMRPVRVPVGRDETDGCPLCGYEYYSKYNFCPGCGQRMEWGDGKNV